MGQSDVSSRTRGERAEQGFYSDVLIVGAGLSGIAAAYHLQRRVPAMRYAILEGRGAMGGTWDLFRYPGVRSDSDIHTLGYSFAPWRGENAITDGASINDYIVETARRFGIDRHIRFNQRAVHAAWSSETARWTVTGQFGETFTCRFLFMCSGYYDYAAGYLPDWPEQKRFAGQVIHPQHWPAQLETAGKQIVVIGSGATAVTLVPALAETAAHVTMLQRSPTYIVSRPAKDALADRLNRWRWLPASIAHGLVRWKNVLLGMYFYRLARRQPERTRAGIAALARRQLPEDFDVGTHLTPRYQPWDQRLCLVPDGDLFTVLRAGKASIVTDGIKHFTETGIVLASGVELPADIVVAATGLNVQLLGGMTLAVDGAAVDLARSVSYKGMMFGGVPNFALMLGYTNASWTLKGELTARFVCRLLRRMQARGDDWCVARADPAVATELAIGLSSGYITRAEALLPKQGAVKPWKLRQNYLSDLAALRFGRLEDGVMTFGRAGQKIGPGA